MLEIQITHLFLKRPNCLWSFLTRQGQRYLSDIPPTGKRDACSSLKAAFTIFCDEYLKYPAEAPRSAVSVFKLVLRGLNTIGEQRELSAVWTTCAVSFGRVRQKYSRFCVNSRCILRRKSPCNPNLNGLRRLSRRLTDNFSLLRRRLLQQSTAWAK